MRIEIDTLDQPKRQSRLGQPIDPLLSDRFQVHQTQRSQYRKVLRHPGWGQIQTNGEFIDCLIADPQILDQADAIRVRYLAQHGGKFVRYKCSVRPAYNSSWCLNWRTRDEGAVAQFSLTRRNCAGLGA